MPTYKAPVEDVQFLLNDVFHMERYGNMPGFSDASPDVVAAILDEAAKFAEEVLQPLNRSRRPRRLQAQRRRQRDHAEGLQGSLSRSMSMAAGSASRCRPSTAGRACRPR